MENETFRETITPASTILSMHCNKNNQDRGLPGFTFPGTISNNSTCITAGGSMCGHFLWNYLFPGPVKTGTFLHSPTSNIPRSVILKDGITGKARNERYIKGSAMLPIFLVTA